MPVRGNINTRSWLILKSTTASSRLAARANRQTGIGKQAARRGSRLARSMKAPAKNGSRPTGLPLTQKKKRRIGRTRHRDDQKSGSSTRKPKAATPETTSKASSNSRPTAPAQKKARSCSQPKQKNRNTAAKQHHRSAQRTAKANRNASRPRVKKATRCASSSQ